VNPTERGIRTPRAISAFRLPPLHPFCPSPGGRFLRRWLLLHCSGFVRDLAACPSGKRSRVCAKANRVKLLLKDVDSRKTDIPQQVRGHWTICSKSIAAFYQNKDIDIA